MEGLQKKRKREPLHHLFFSTASGLVLFFLFLFPSCTDAQTRFIWSKPGDGLWKSDGSWNYPGYPDSTFEAALIDDRAGLPSGAVLLNSSATVFNLAVAQNRRLVIKQNSASGNSRLTIQQYSNVYSTNLELKGSYIGRSLRIQVLDPAAVLANQNSVDVILRNEESGQTFTRTANHLDSSTYNSDLPQDQIPYFITFVPTSPAPSDGAVCLSDISLCSGFGDYLSATFYPFLTYRPVKRRVRLLCSPVHNNLLCEKSNALTQQQYQENVVDYIEWVLLDRAVEEDIEKLTDLEVKLRSLRETLAGDPKANFAQLESLVPFNSVGESAFKLLVAMEDLCPKLEKQLQKIRIPTSNPSCQ